MRASYYKVPNFLGVEASELIAMYSERKRLAELGVTVSASEIPAHICDAFLVIESALDTIQAEEAKKKKAKNGR